MADKLPEWQTSFIDRQTAINTADPQRARLIKGEYLVRAYRGDRYCVDSARLHELRNDVRYLELAAACGVVESSAEYMESVTLLQTMLNIGYMLCLPSYANSLLRQLQLTARDYGYEIAAELLHDGTSDTNVPPVKLYLTKLGLRVKCV